MSSVPLRHGGPGADLRRLRQQDTGGHPVWCLPGLLPGTCGRRRPCPNWLCNDAGRRIERIDASPTIRVARDKIHRYKYEGKTGWSLIFGRLLVAGLMPMRLMTHPI